MWGESPRIVSRSSAPVGSSGKPPFRVPGRYVTNDENAPSESKMRKIFRDPVTRGSPVWRSRELTGERKLAPRRNARCNLALSCSARRIDSHAPYAPKMHRAHALRGIVLTFALAASLAASVGCGDDGESPSGGGGDAAGSSTATVTNGVECDGDTCDPAIAFCGFAAGTCEGPRTCQAYPECGESTLVCGCDGESYTETCIALELSGGAKTGACPAPEGKFTCSYEYQIPVYCELGAEYCHVDPGGSAYELGCEPLPAACGETPDCACTGDPCAENYCGIDEDTGTITVLCPLGA